MSFLIKKTPFLSTGISGLIKEWNLSDDFWKCFNLLALKYVREENEIDTAAVVCFQNDIYKVENKVWTL